MSGAAGATHWAALAERGAYFGVLFMLRAYQLCGRRAFSALLVVVMAYFFLTGGAARRASRAFLTAVRNDPRGQAALPAPPGVRQVFRHFMSFGDAILDKLRAWTGQIDIADIHIENSELFDDLVQRQAGAVLVTSHLGNAEVCRALASRVDGLKLNVLVHTRHARNFNRALRALDDRASLALIEVTDVGPETAMRLQEAVDRGEFVVIVADRTPPTPKPRVAWAPFFGRPAPFPIGPFALAAILRQPTLMMFCVKDGAKFRLIFEAFPQATTGERARHGRARRVEAAVAQFAARLEHYAAAYPYQWFNFFDFWRQA